MSEVKLHPLQSSHLDRIGYDADAQMMHVIFKDGSHYAYHNVPHRTFSQLLKADSPGEHFREHIKPNHRSTKIK
jgi:KTSC domain